MAKTSQRQRRRFASGHAFEDEIENMCEIYRRFTWAKSMTEILNVTVPGDQDPTYVPRFQPHLQNSGVGGRPVAVIARAHPKTLGRPGQMRYARGRNGVDFVGQINTPNGETISVAFDTKVCNQASWKLPAKDRYQAEWLLDFKAGGGLAGFLIRSGEIAFWVDDLSAAYSGERTTLTFKTRGHLGRRTRLPHIAQANIRGIGRGFDFARLLTAVWNNLRSWT